VTSPFFLDDKSLLFYDNVVSASPSTGFVVTRWNKKTHPLVLSNEGLQKFSRLLAHSCLLLAVAIPLSAGASWFGLDRQVLLSRPGLPTGADPDDWLFALAGIVALVPPVLLAAALLAGRKSFRCIAEGHHIAHDAIDHLRTFGRFIVFASASGLVTPTIVGLVLTADADPGHRSLIINFGSAELLGILFGGMIWAITALLARAAALADEHAQIV
jgi:hypothetical protein